jgi:hypothetical protein
MLAVVIAMIAAAAVAVMADGAAGRARDGVAGLPAAPIRIDAPRSGALIAAQRVGRRRLTASVDLSGTAQAGSQLWLEGSCGRVDCEALTYANGEGRWHMRMQLTTARGRHAVAMRISYWPAPPAGAPVAARLILRSSVPLAPPTPSPGAPPSPAIGGGMPADTRPELLMIGDSLAIGTAQPLVLDLPGWDVKFDARIGRPLSEGMEILTTRTAPPEPTARRRILAFSLYTNDPPADVTQLDAAVRASVAQLGAHGCAIWATISRPAAHKITYRAANARLLELAQDPLLAGRLLVVPWAEEVARHHGWKAPDHVHATAAGYLARARMYAEAATACQR